MTTDIRELDRQLNAEILAGRALEAFEIYYADNVVMQENDHPPTVGKAANRQREKDFFAAVTEFRGAEVLATGAGDNVTFSQWFMDYTHRDWGAKTYKQVAVRTWKDGKIVNEVFYYG